MTNHARATLSRTARSGHGSLVRNGGGPFQPAEGRSHDKKESGPMTQAPEQAQLPLPSPTPMVAIAPPRAGARTEIATALRNVYRQRTDPNLPAEFEFLLRRLREACR